MKKIILLLLVIGFFACDDKPQQTDNTVVKVDTVVSPVYPVSPVTPRGLMAPVGFDSLVIVADTKGNIKIGDQTVDLEKLENKLVDTLQFMKRSYGRLPDTIIYHSKGDVLMGTRGAIKDAILDAKEKVKKQ
jgi:hypothetical protein